MKWYNYLACFLAGVFLIHIVPHLMHGMSAVNVAGVLVSLGRRLPFAVGRQVLVERPLGDRAAVLIFVGLHPHHHHKDALVHMRSEG